MTFRRSTLALRGRYCRGEAAEKPALFSYANRFTMSRNSAIQMEFALLALDRRSSNSGKMEVASFLFVDGTIGTDVAIRDAMAMMGLEKRALMHVPVTVACKAAHYKEDRGHRHDPESALGHCIPP
jgi:hypothetical protein